VVTEDSPEGAPVAANDAQRAPSLMTATREQLGLKLELRKFPLEVLVVDHMEKLTTEN
jgi:uncharacterized protein (TIGR03435 family)